MIKSFFFPFGIIIPQLFIVSPISTQSKVWVNAWRKP
jgi:hypothetical protein